MEAKEKCEKILVVAGELIPGTLTLDTSALTTELRQPMTSKTFTFYLSGRHRKVFLTALNWWSVEYETAASRTTQQ